MANDTLAGKIADALDNNLGGCNRPEHEMVPLIQSILNAEPVRGLACSWGKNCQLFDQGLIAATEEDVRLHRKCSGTLTELIER